MNILVSVTRDGSRSRDWRGPYGERGAPAYNGGLGAVSPAGSRGRAPGQGVRGRSPPEAERFWCCYMSEMALNCYVYELFIVINGSCSTNMYARQLSFNFSSMVWGAMAPCPPFPLDPPLWASLYTAHGVYYPDTAGLLHPGVSNVKRLWRL